ncbi:MAG: L-serine ammonia-lyase, iron-sulfur-dependent, subunit alpha [Clostridia bacterium]|nr:L-serine ammonia-lyase, iron-sulfur-dependent, subunit alpha [Clostridia bacterium]
MKSIREIYKIGRGPSSSHTMGPERACLYMKEKYKRANCFEVTLYGSLAKTGAGHRTDYAIRQTFDRVPCLINKNTEKTDLPHPNTMEIAAIRNGEVLGKETVCSIGGGDIEINGVLFTNDSGEIYPESTFAEIAVFCKEKDVTLSDYVSVHEGADIWNTLGEVWDQMQKTVYAGLHTEGILPGGLGVRRRAMELRAVGKRERNLIKKENYLIAACAYAASEENAAGERMVTAPTCGASGVLPAVLYYEKELFGVDRDEIIQALAVAGLVGQLIKTNASVSGAEAGCQAEIGSACAMAAAALAALHGQGIQQIECAAEMAMEHCLGLTCDPVGGLVQIPCIERNAVAALKAYNAASLAEVVYDNRKVSFDLVVKTMYATGKDLSACYRETADGGLAKLYVKNFD